MKRARVKNKKAEIKEEKTRRTKGTSSKTKKTGGKTKKKKRTKIMAAVLVCFVVFVFVVLGMGGGGDNALVPIDTSTGKMNVLLLGVDEEGLRTDAIMIASYDFDTESVKLLSIPRDTKMYVTNRKVTRKINEIHAMSKKGGGIMGPFGSVEAVTALTGIPINYYVEFSFDAIDEIADILGPVTFDVPDIEGGGKGMNYDDPTQNLHIHLKPGVQELSGNQYQQFLRYRKSNNEKVDGSDLSRVKRQHEFVKAIVEQKVNLSLIVKVSDIYAKVKKNIKTNFSSGEIAKYSTHLLKLTSDNITTYSLPGEDKHSSAWYFECNFDEARSLIETEFGYDASETTNKVEITGEKIGAAKASKKAEEPLKNGNSDKKNTSTKSEDNTEATVKPTSKATAKPTEKPTEKPRETESPSKPKATQEPEEPVKTKAPQKTTEPYRPTAKPTQEPEDDVVVVD